MADDHQETVEDEEKQKRLRSIQPVILVDIIRTNVRPSDFEATYSNPSTENQRIIAIAEETQKMHKREEHPVHDVWLSIENAGDIPIRNLVIFNELFFSVIKAGESKEFILTYDYDGHKTMHVTRDKKNYYEIPVARISDEPQREESSDGFKPDEILMNYKDLDGNWMNWSYVKI